MHIFNVWTSIMQSLNINVWIWLELQITRTRHPLSISDGKKCLSSTPFKNEKKIMKRAPNKMCTFSICEQSLGKVWLKRNENSWSYRFHKLGTPKMLRTDGQTRKMSKFNTHQKWEKMKQYHKIWGAHLQCANNHYAKFEYKGMNTAGVTDYTN